VPLNPPALRLSIFHCVGRSVRADRNMQQHSLFQLAVILLLWSLPRTRFTIESCLPPHLCLCLRTNTPSILFMFHFQVIPSIHGNTEHQGERERESVCLSPAWWEFIYLSFGSQTHISAGRSSFPVEISFAPALQTSLQQGVTHLMFCPSFAWIIELIGTPGNSWSLSESVQSGMKTNCSPLYTDRLVGQGAGLNR